jgi:ABC-type transport system substrate-binding protein
MFKKALVAILALAIVSMMFAPVFAWEYWYGEHDELYEQWGPHASQILIKLYDSEISEWETGIENGEIDITDWPLDHTHLARYTSPPWSEKLNVYDYGAEFGLYLFDLNNNNNTFLGNPPNPAYPNPRYPNPMGYTVAQSGNLYDNGYVLRHAIAHHVNRDAVVSYVGEEAAVAVYTPLPPCYGKYCHPDIKPGGALEELTHPYDPVESNAILDASGMFPYGLDGWRYWDRNRNGVYDGPSEYLVLKIISRIDHRPRDYMGTLLELELLGQKIHVVNLHLTITAARIQWMTNKDANIYTAGWSFTATPDVLTLWQWQYYWHPGRPYNSAGCNKDAFNDAADGVSYANTQDDAIYWCRIASEVFCESVLSITVYNSRGFKVMSKTSVDPLAIGQKWYGVVNWPGYGIDNFYSFKNMHTSCQKWCNTIRYGFKTVDLRQLNPIYTEWLWDNTVIDLIGYDSLVARNPYTMAFTPWVCKTFSIGTYQHPVYGTCSKIVFTLRNDVYFQDGTQLTVADVFFTFVEIDDLLAARGLSPPWWISNVQNILSFSILDPMNFEVLLDVKSMFAIGWIGGNRILPKHIWKPIVTGAIAPKSGVAWDPTTFAPDPNMIGSGQWRLDEYVESSHILLVANRPSSVVDTGIKCLDPNANSVPIHSPKGYFRLKPKYVDIHADNWRAKILCKESVPPCNPQKWMWVNLTATDTNLWMERLDFIYTTLTPPYIGQHLWFENESLEAPMCEWEIVDWIDGNLPEYPPNGILSVGDILRLLPITITPPKPGQPTPPPGVTICVAIKDILTPEINMPRFPDHNELLTGQVIEALKYVYVDLNSDGDYADIGEQLVVGEHEYEKPNDPIVETFTVNLTKCFHTVTLAKKFITEWFLCPNNAFDHYPYDLWINVTWPIWITIKEDIVGSYYVNTQLLAPDCKVDLKDVFAAGKAFGSVPGDAKWNTVADINGDYKIDLKDYFAICKKFGKW